jgi:hypothetical protein
MRARGGDTVAVCATCVTLSRIEKQADRHCIDNGPTATGMIAVGNSLTSQSPDWTTRLRSFVSSLAWLEPRPQLPDLKTTECRVCGRSDTIVLEDFAALPCFSGWQSHYRIQHPDERGAAIQK